MASTAAAAGASSSLAAPLSPKKYDVFISFRGDDTRITFTSHLHDALCRNKIETYIDDRLDKGDKVWLELVKAIHGSSIFLVILSKDYASSSWCLNELIEIMECKEKGHVVFPVFYNTDPSDVRKQTGSYQTAFAKHMIKQSDDTVQKWKAALSEVADVSGFHSSSYRTEVELVNEIIKAVLRKLNYKCPIQQGDIIKNQNYEEIESFVKLETKEVRIIGIWGMGGIGKTTVATAIFNEVSSQYEGSCFLANVREESKKHGINSLFDKLLFELLREEIQFDTHMVKTSSFLQSKLRYKKIFVVLDDVNTFDLLEKLVGKRDWLGAGSIVIVTTRDKHMFSKGVDKIHEVKKMSDQDSLRLFCLSAFNEEHPQEGYEKLSGKAVEYARGFPLALTVLGSFLRSKSENEWDSALSKLKKIPVPKIQKVLRLSYDGLDDTEQNIFLDIAFFFRGDERGKVIKILNACGFHATIGIRILLDKALITIDSSQCIDMHDLIQEMGWEIVRKEFKNPGSRSRLRDPIEVCDVLKNNKETFTVEGILLDMTQITDLYISPKAFKKMTNLRILAFTSYRDRQIINSVYLTTDHKLLSNNLKYFRWDGYPLKSLSSIFSPENLVEISMVCSNVEKLWNGGQNLPNLEEINIRNCPRLMEIPDLSGAPKLKSVDLQKCGSLRHVHPSIFSLNELEILTVSECKALKSLCGHHCSPSLSLLAVRRCFNLEEFSVTMVGNYPKTSLHFEGLGLNEVPSSILNLRNLLSFSFPICESLMNLPENFAHFISLCDAMKQERDALITLRTVLPSPAFRSVRRLSLELYDTVTELPDNMCLLSSLEQLYLEGRAVISLPESIKYLPRLASLDVRGCEKLRSVPALPQSIELFDASYCRSLKTVLSSKSEPPKKHEGIFRFKGCINLDQDAHNNILKDAIVRIELAAKSPSAVVLQDKRKRYINVETGIFYLLPARRCKVEDWFYYCSTQALLTVELPPNSKFLGFVFYVILSKALSRDSDYGTSLSLSCECHMETSWCERFDVSSSVLTDPFRLYMDLSSRIMSDHVLLWYDPEYCKRIMEAVEKTKAINEGHATSNPKLKFEFFVRRNDEIVGVMKMKKCGLRWIEEGGGPKFKTSGEIYELEGSAVQNEAVGSESEEEEEAVGSESEEEEDSESEEEEEAVPPAMKFKQRSLKRKRKQFLQQRNSSNVLFPLPPAKKFKQCSSIQVEALRLSLQERLHISEDLK